MLSHFVILKGVILDLFCKLQSFSQIYYLCWGGTFEYRDKLEIRIKEHKGFQRFMCVCAEIKISSNICVQVVNVNGQTEGGGKLEEISASR